MHALKRKLLVGVWLAAASLFANSRCTEVADDNGYDKIRKEALVSFDITDGLVTAVEIMGIYDEGVLGSLGRLRENGDLKIQLTDRAERDVLAQGYLPDPRLAYWDKIVQGGLGGGAHLGKSGKGLVVLPAPLPSRGKLLFSLGSSAALEKTFKFKLDFQNRTAEYEVFGLSELPELVHLGGPANPSSAFLIVFVPHGFGDDMNAFMDRVRDYTSWTMAADWFNTHGSEFSFWASKDEETNATTGVDGWSLA
jgi:hypothetical protein